ncbi:MAG: hypothetical protein R2729_27975 [Bryobacteraceae bacterium]
MPEIRIDGIGIATPDDPDASLGRYLLRNLPLALAPGGLEAMLDRPLSEVDLAAARGGLVVQDSADAGNGAAEWTISAGANAEIGIWNRAADTVLASEQFGPKTELKVPANRAFVGLSFRGRLATGPAVDRGDLTFGFSAGGSLEVSYYTPMAASTPLRKALENVLREFVVPGDLEDLAKLGPKSAASVRGSGRVEFRVSGSVATVVNPLAVEIPVVSRPLGVTAGASVAVSVGAAFVGEYEIRVVGLGGRRVSLGLYRASGGSFDVSVAASAGASGGIGGMDISGAILGAVVGRPEVDRDLLRDAGLSEGRIDDLRDTVREAANHKLAASLEAGFASLRTSGPAFLFTVDLEALDAESSRAVREALDGDFGALTADGELTGVRMERSIAHESLRESNRLRINLFGIFNHESLFAMLRKGKEVYDPSSGEILFLDEVTARRRSAWIDNTRRISTERVARLMADTMLIALSHTAAAGETEMEIEHWYFEYQRRTNAAGVKDDFDAAVALELSQPGEVTSLLPRERFNRVTLLAETRYDASLARRVFLRPSGSARPRADFEDAGRHALLLLEGGDEADSGRAQLGSDDVLYRAIANVGSHQGAVAAMKARGVAAGLQEAMYTDYLAIAWWADAMRTLAEDLAELDRFRNEAPDGLPVDAANAYRKLRKRLQDHLGDVVSRTKPLFGEPWGLVAMFVASGGKAPAHVRITAEGLRYDRSRDWERAAAAVAGAGG